MTPTPQAERITRLARQLARLYPQLFQATTRGQEQRERDSRNPARNDRPGPARVEVLDLIREVNQACLELHAVVLDRLGFAPQAPPVDVRYRQSPRVTEALQFLDRAAPAIDHAHLEDGQPLGPYVADWLAALVREARRLLGHSGKALNLTRLVGVTCPADLGARLEDGRWQAQPCGGELWAVLRLGQTICRACGDRQDWETLGRTVSAQHDRAAA